MKDSRPPDRIDTSLGMTKGFDYAEARGLLELAVNINEILTVDEAGREGRDTPPHSVETNPGSFGWTKIAEGMREAKSRFRPETADIGMGPHNNGWQFWQKGQSDVYAIVIRGTESNRQSISQDAIATSISANAILEVGTADDGKRYWLPLVLASTPQAETDLGFTYGAATLLFHRDDGILATLRERNPKPGSKIFITGHSQGAAIATLVHAYIHHAINETEHATLGRLNPDGHGLAGKSYSLKSYLFAQPKPGNSEFALDFARIAGSSQAAYVINNNLDWVPKVPLALQGPSEVYDELYDSARDGRGLVERVISSNLLKFAMWGVKRLRSFGAGVSQGITDDPFIAFSRDGLNHQAFVPVDHSKSRPEAFSLNYSAAGNLIPVFGEYGVSNDWMHQHHGTTYRSLVEKQLSHHKAVMSP